MLVANHDRWLIYHWHGKRLRLKTGALNFDVPRVFEEIVLTWAYFLALVTDSFTDIAPAST
ncbi:MAG: hypothetical protein Q4A71_04930 [Actinomycetaceae bacterium]|nr:hypothetical protein [Actinomycetaceae bacterium]